MSTIFGYSLNDMKEPLDRRFAVAVLCVVLQPAVQVPGSGCYNKDALVGFSFICLLRLPRAVETLEKNGPEPSKANGL